MIKVLLIVCGIFLLCAIVFFFLWRLSLNKNKTQKKRIDDLTIQLEAAETTNTILEQTIKILKKNREAADEKIDGLHNGDSVSNALNELSNNKN